MPHHTKIATCCYCGTKAALVLRGKERHELSCAACGAPLHDMKALKMEATRAHPVERKPSKKERRKVGATPMAVWERETGRKGKKKKPKKSLTRRLFSEAFDVIEDIFD